MQKMTPFIAKGNKERMLFLFSFILIIAILAISINIDFNCVKNHCKVYFVS